MASYQCIWSQKWDLESKMTHLEIPPEITTEGFSRSWTRFKLVVAANKERQQCVLPALLRAKLLDYYPNLGDDKETLKALTATLIKKKAGINRDSLRASKLFNGHCQGPQRSQ